MDQHSSGLHPWYAIHVKSRQEKVVACSLEGKGILCYLPLYRVRRGKSSADLPLFSGYLFARLDIQNRLPVLKIPGVVSIVSARRTPIPVAEEEIRALQAVTSSGVPAVPWPFTKLGQRVVVQKGPLRGVEGILRQAKGQQRIVISVTLLQRSISVEIDRDVIVPIGQYGEAR